MSKRSEVSCDDCYFRQASLCALQLDAPCPTFRHAQLGELAPPRQARLIARPVHRFPRTPLAPQHQAA